MNLTDYPSSMAATFEGLRSRYFTFPLLVLIPLLYAWPRTLPTLFMVILGFHLVGAVFVAVQTVLNIYEIVLLVLTFIASTLTVVSGRASILQASIHLSIFGAFLVFATLP